MKVFNIRNDFGVYDISDEQDVSEILMKISVGLETHVVLDLSGCLVDYPATSKLLDKVIDQLDMLEGKKKLEIVTDFILPMPTVVNWLFLGSVRLGMELKKGSDYAGLIRVARSNLSPQIELKISIKNGQGELKEEVIIDHQN